MSQHFNTVDLLRLEVAEPADMVNLVSNPSGESGGAGYTTPVPNTLIAADDGALRFTTLASQAAYWTTEEFEVPGGVYVGAALRLLGGTAGHYVNVRVQWIDGAGTVTTTSASPTWAVGSGLGSYGPVQAPAGTVRARVHWSLWGGANGVAAPAANGYVRFDQVTVVTTSDAATLGGSRTNYASNPSMETNATGWSGTAATLARTTAAASVGAASLAITCSDNVQAAARLTGPGSAHVTAGETWTVSLRVRAATVAKNGRIGASFGGLPGVVSAGAWTTVPTSEWATLTHTFTVPTGATGINLELSITGQSGNTFYADAALIEKAPTAGPYFDGSTTGTGSVRYAWQGAPNNSFSTRSESFLGYVVPQVWRNILGPATDLKIVREELNLGTLNATVRDATLDPATADLLRPGKAVRLTALTPTGTWEPLFTGDLTDAKVTYDLKRRRATDPKHARIALTATDNTSRLAAASRPQGVATVAEVPWLMEGAGVPWSVDGNGGQVPTATVVSVNDNATLIDQIAITRDTTHARAWVDRSGVLRMVSPGYRPNLVPNPRMTTDASAWVPFIGCTIARAASTPKVSGAPTLVLTSTPGDDSMAAATSLGTAGIPITPGARVTGAADLYWDVAFDKANPNPPPLAKQLVLVGSDAAGEIVWLDGADPSDINPRIWTTASHAATIPAGVAYLSVAVGVIGLPTTGGHKVHTREVQAYATDDVALAETEYTDLAVDFDSARVINDVTVKLRRPNAATGATEEVAFGPYRNTESAAIWGVRSATFTVHGIPEANIPAYAQRILAANANPTIRATSAQVAVTQPDHIAPNRALLDVGQLCRVYNTDKGLSDLLTITKVEHTITPTKWLARVDFDRPTSVASPQVTPPLQTGPVLATGWQALPLSAGWTAYGVGYHDPSYMVEGRTVTLRGLVRRTGGTAAAGSTFATLPPGARPTRIVGPPATLWPASDEVGCRVTVTALGAMSIDAWAVNTDGYVFLDAITFRTD